MSYTTSDGRPWAKPHLLTFTSHGRKAIGYLTVAQSEIPFPVKRVFWTYGVPPPVMRGKHAHKKTEQVLVAVKGIVTVTVWDAANNSERFRLSSPDTGLYVPPDHWHTMTYSPGAIQLTIVSTEYDEADYIRKKSDYRKLYAGR